MVVTDDEDLAERCRMLRNLCFKRDARYVHDEISDNYRFTNLQAAVGLAQLERLDEFVKRKREMGKYYTEALKGVKGLQLPVARTENAENISWVYGLLLDEDIPADNKRCRSCCQRRGSGRGHSFGVCMNSRCIRNRDCFKTKAIPMRNILPRKVFIYRAGWL